MDLRIERLALLRSSFVSYNATENRALSTPQSPLTTHPPCILAFLIHNSSFSLLANCMVVQKLEMNSALGWSVSRSPHLLLSVLVIGLVDLPHGSLISDGRQFRCLELLSRARFQIVLPLQTCQNIMACCHRPEDDARSVLHAVELFHCCTPDLKRQQNAPAVALNYSKLELCEFQV